MCAFLAFTRGFVFCFYKEAQKKKQHSVSWFFANLDADWFLFHLHADRFFFCTKKNGVQCLCFLFMSNHFLGDLDADWFFFFHFISTRGYFFSVLRRSQEKTRRLVSGLFFNHFFWGDLYADWLCFFSIYTRIGFSFLWRSPEKNGVQCFFLFLCENIFWRFKCWLIFFSFIRG